MENYELDQNNKISKLLSYELAKSNTLVSDEVLLYISTKGDSFSNHECGKDDVNLSGPVIKLMEDKADSFPTDNVADTYSSRKIVSERQIFTDQPMHNFSGFQYFDFNELGDEPKTHQDPSIEANLENSSFREEKQYESKSNGFGRKTRCGRTRYGSDSLLTMILRERSKANAEVENLRENVDTPSKGSLAASLSRQNVDGFPGYENPSFSASSPPSGLLAFPGSIPYSGSISQRSNSTTSARSFAFPILAPEWNDSPVRMAEADRPRSRKPRCWGISFNCCRIRVL